MSITSMLGRVSLGKKFAVFGVLGIALVAAPLTMYIRTTMEAIDTAKVEKAGVPSTKSLLRLIHVMQQHRGLAAGVLAGNAGLEADRAATQSEVDKALDAFLPLVNADDDAKIKAASAKIADGWKSITKAVVGRTISGRDSTLKHNELIEDDLILMDSIADHFGLSLDPDADSYHLVMATVIHLPQLAEALGQVRARGTAQLTQKSMTVEDRFAMLGLLGLVNTHYANMIRVLNKAFDMNAGLKTALAATTQESQQQVQTAIKLVREQIMDADKLTLSPADYFAAVTRSLDAQFKLNGAALEELDKVLTSRISRLHTNMAYMIAIIALLSGLAVAIGVAVTRSIVGPVNRAVEMARKVAAGDLTGTVEVTGSDEIGALLQALSDMNGSLKNIVGQVRVSTETIGTASRQIAAGNQDLSQRTEEQASSLEETASSMEELTSTVKQNAENARQANQLAAGASDVAVRGGVVVKQVVDTMSGISAASNKIADIIGVIDGIAFQTNILALNAAVEAARAGEQGRGFAVVAAEVRNLAQRSAAAAKEIKSLIEDSAGQVTTGSRLVDEAGKTMDEVVMAVKRVTDIMSEITAASQEQSSGIEQVNQAVMQMDQVTQQNAALVEEAAAAAESMQEQAEQLTQAVSIFALDQRSTGVAAYGVAPDSSPRSAERRGPNRASNVARLPAKARNSQVSAGNASVSTTAKGKKASGSDEEWTEF